jgi:Na+/proline symporter
MLRYSVVFLQVLTSVIYLSAQVIALKGTFNSIFGLDPGTMYPVIIIMILILIFECIGGLNSVAFTDSVQAVIMVFSFVAIPIIIARNFGGWDTLDPENYPQPSFYQTPSGDTQWKFWQFCLINFSFFTLPHFLQRIYAVKDLQSLRIGYAVSEKKGKHKTEQNKTKQFDSIIFNSIRNVTELFRMHCICIATGIALTHLLLRFIPSLRY